MKPYVYMYTCMYACYIYMHEYVYVYICTHTYTFIFILPFYEHGSIFKTFNIKMYYGRTTAMSHPQEETHSDIDGTLAL